VQVLPLVLVLLALPAMRVRRDEWRELLVGDPDPVTS
jgi:hypothetical protein